MSASSTISPGERVVNLRPFLIAATVLLVLVAADATYLAVKAALPPPAPSIATNGVYTTILDSSCAAPAFQDIQYVVKVQNTGGLGFANVAFEVDGNVHDAQTLQVGPNTYVWVTDVVFLSDCSTHTTSAEVIAQWP